MAIDKTLQSDDPLSMVYSALWSLLEDTGDFSARVKDANRVKYIGKLDRLPEKDEVLTADLPEVRIVATGGIPHQRRTSNSSFLLKRFAIQISTGDRRLDAELFPVEWAVYKALADWPTPLMALLWEGSPYVKLARPLEITEAPVGTPERGVTGWYTVFACEVEMWFTTSDLINTK